MNILIISPIMPPEIGGPASYVPEIIKRLGNDFRFRVITFSPNPILIKNIPIISISQNGGMLARQARLIWAILMHSWWADLLFAQEPLVAGVAAGLVSKIVKKPMVIRFVGYQPWEDLLALGQTKKFLDGFLDNPDGGIKSRVYIWMTMFVFKITSNIIVPSKYLATVLQKYFLVPAEKITHIYNDFEIPKVVPATKQKEKTAISIGRIIIRKHVDWTIEAVARYTKNTGQYLRLLIVGDGPNLSRLEKITKQLVKKYQIKPFVKFLGRKSWVDGLSILKASDVYILTSIYEGLPFTVVESLVLGVPVVATDIPGTNEVAINNQTALTAPPGAINQLAKNIERLLIDPKLAKKLVTNGQKMIKEKFTWKENILKTNTIFSELTKNP